MEAQPLFWEEDNVCYRDIFDILNLLSEIICHQAQRIEVFQNFQHLTKDWKSVEIVGKMLQNWDTFLHCLDCNPSILEWICIKEIRYQYTEEKLE